MSGRRMLWLQPGLAIGLCFAACGEATTSQRDASLVPRLVDRSGVNVDLARRLDQAADAVESDLADREAWIELAGICDANQLWGQAERAYLGALALDEDAKCNYHLGRVRVWIGELTGALEAFERSIGFVDWYVPTHTRRATVLMQLGRIDEARVAFERALELDSGTLAGRLGLARLHLIDTRAQAAVDVLEPLIERNPRNPLANDLLARSYRQLGRMELAERAARRGARSGETAFDDPWVEEVSRHSVGAHVAILRADARAATGDHAGAIRLLEPYRREFAVLNPLLSAYLGAGRIDDAEALAGEARAQHGAHFRVELADGRVCVARGAIGKARAYFERATMSNPHFGPGSSELGSVEMRLGRFEQAARSFRNAIEAGETSARDWTLLARAMLAGERYAEALAVIQEAFVEYPNSMNLWGTKALAEARAGRLDAARESLARIEKRNPKHESVARVRARIAEFEGAAVENR